MLLRELTKEEQDFAAENHNIVYAFLRARNLCHDDYYDVVIFGYLQAVRKYLSRDDLRQRYAFSTVAWRKMQNSLTEHFKKQSRRSRKAVTVSWETAIIGNGTFAAAEIVTGQNSLMEQLDMEFLWDEISSLLTKPQTEALRMQADGYSTHEIAALQRSPLCEVEELLDSAQETVRELCLV